MKNYFINNILNILLVMIALLIANNVYTQAPQAFKYQAIARDGQGNILANKDIGIRIKILLGIGADTVVYSEVHNTRTNQFGLIHLEIGNGEDKQGSIETINWQAADFYLQVEMGDISSSIYQVLGKSQLLSVPYAMYADKAGNTFSGKYNDLSDLPDIIDSVSAILDTTTKFLTYEIDSSITNEIQTLADVISQNNSANGQIKDMDDPTDDQDAATKAYVDALEKQIQTLQNTMKGGGYVEDIENNFYNTFKIGDQIWMAENLKTTKYNDGTEIPLVLDSATWRSLSTPGYCWYNNDSSYANVYGVLYNWFAIDTASNGNKNICPDGWHIPTDAEWEELEISLGIPLDVVNDMGRRGTNEGSKIATNKNLWTDGILKNDPEFGSSGFNALPGGYRNQISQYRDFTTGSHWWSATEYFTNMAYYRGLLYNHSDICKDNHFKVTGFSVRCLKD